MSLTAVTSDLQCPPVPGVSVLLLSGLTVSAGEM